MMGEMALTSNQFEKQLCVGQHDSYTQNDSPLLQSQSAIDLLLDLVLYRANLLKETNPEILRNYSLKLRLRAIEIDELLNRF
ncbi:hypothetical protein [Shewanella morhuae]|uniref:Uncharacterized protein n=1 Tax=Shewanella morhuae TaxID=365591 RepID=A0A380C1N9_9GAMM|nr:hypothetical protein [Shewanella morhuae]SUJ09979.1 Uncharacterised protein [Shewanella morhuae]